MKSPGPVNDDGFRAALPILLACYARAGRHQVDGLCGVPDGDIETFAHSPERSIDLFELGGMTKVKEAINLWTVPPEETAYGCFCHTPDTRLLVQLHLRRSQRRQGHAPATARRRWRRDILAPCDSSGQCFLDRIRSALKRVL
jgi:hypothetical protein